MSTISDSGWNSVKFVMGAIFSSFDQLDDAYSEFYCVERSFEQHSKPNMLVIPNEILLRIALNIDATSDMNALSRTCRTLHGLTHEKSFIQEWSSTYGWNDPSDVTRNALFSAAIEGRVLKVQHLIQFGFVKVHQGGAFALRAACQNGHLELVKLLLDCGALQENSKTTGGLLVAIASEHGRLSIVEELCERRGFSVDEYENAALRFACRGGHFHVVNYLLGKGADPNAQNGQPMRIAVKYRHSQICALLRAYRALILVPELMHEALL
mmetsp:Transcript_834/g.1572  ORF Transcript_834/g.1572 Transcript_834/m.1572 type:complete len:268 (+) Transcript_834:3628-4431(+)